MASQIPGDITFAFLSGATTSGVPTVTVAATASPGTLIHTAVSGTDDLDLVELVLYNKNTSSNVNATLEIGSTQITQTVTRGQSLSLPLIPVNNGTVIRCFAGTANDIIIVGRVFTITDGTL